MNTRTRIFPAPAAILLAVALTAPAIATAQDAPPKQPEGQATGEQPQGEQATEQKPTREPGEPDTADLSEEQRQAYEEHLRAGKAAYAKQDFDTAFKHLEAAYTIHGKPSILFNLALISEKGGALERSVEYYQKFLEAPGVTLENRQRASERLATIQEILRTSASAEEARQKQVTDLLPALEAMGLEAAVTTPTETTTTTQTTTTTGDTTTTQTTTTQTTTTQTEEPAVAATMTPDVDYKWPVYAAFGTATAALVGGVVFVALTNNAIEDGKAAALAGDTAGHADAEDRASMRATTAAGLFIGGAALAVVGSYFVVRSSMQAEEEAAAAQSKPTASLGLSLHKNFLGPVFNLKF